MNVSSFDLESPERVLDQLASRGGDSYFGEPVTVLEHSLQAAHFAREANSPDTLIVAALLHDVGHLLHHEGESVADLGLDTRHEELADRLLAAHLPPLSRNRFACTLPPSATSASPMRRIAMPCRPRRF